MSLSPKQPLKKLKLKLYLEKFFVYELWQYLLIITVLRLCAWLFNKPFETLMFLIAHCVIRGGCSKQFHCNSVIELAKDWLNDTDVGEGKTLKYYLYVVCEK